MAGMGTLSSAMAPQNSSLPTPASMGQPNRINNLNSFTHGMPWGNFGMNLSSANASQPTATQSYSPTMMGPVQPEMPELEGMDGGGSGGGGASELQSLVPELSQLMQMLQGIFSQSGGGGQSTNQMPSEMRASNPAQTSMGPFGGMGSPFGSYGTMGPMFARLTESLQ